MTTPPNVPTPTAPPAPERPLIERVHLDIIATDAKGHDWRVWTDGTHLRWSGPRGVGGFTPVALFRLAAYHLAERCESEAIGEDADQGDEFFNAVHDSIGTPIEQAAAHPYWQADDDAAPEDARDNKMGFAGVAVVTSLDEPATGLLKDRAGGGT